MKKKPTLDEITDRATSDVRQVLTGHVDGIMRAADEPHEVIALLRDALTEAWSKGFQCGLEATRSR